MEQLTLIQQMAALALPILFGVTLHEAAHGWVADKLGDGTARRLGRVSLNPLRHIDWIGTLIVPLAMFALTGFLFGWAKPVPIDVRNLRRPRRDMALVALAGPGANLFMAICWSLLLVLGGSLAQDSPWLALPLIFTSAAGVLINIILMILNLIPIPPLDGGRVLSGLLPPAAARIYGKIEPYGLFLLVALLLSGVLGRFIWPMVIGMIDLLPGSTMVLNIFLR